MNRKESYLMMFFSFISGLIIMLLLVVSIQSLKPIKIEKCEISNTSLKNAIDKIKDSVFYLESYFNKIKEKNGTAFVYKKDNQYGYLVTNEHVIGKGNIIKLTSPKDEVIEATLLGKDAILDIAVLRIDKKYITQVAILGNSEEEDIGNTVFTYGSPLGYNYRGSVTSGILSGKNRMITTSISQDNSSDVMMNVLQVDAAINPGNSGGPLVNRYGEVIGICTLKLVKEDVEGMGFAIPIEYVKSHISTLEKKEEIKWPKLGITISEINDTATLLKNNISVNIDQEEGVVVIDPKDNNILKKGDIVIKINNNNIKNKASLRYELYKYKIGDSTTLTYIRNHKEYKTNIKLK